MHHLPARPTARRTAHRSLWSRHTADRLDRLTTDRRLSAGGQLPDVLGLR